MKILQRNLNRSRFVVWEMKRNVSVVRVIVATRNSGPPASQPACFLPDAPLSWSLCHLTEGAYTIRLLLMSVSVCVSSQSIVGKCILISGKIIKEMSGSVVSGTHCIIQWHKMYVHFMGLYYKHCFIFSLKMVFKNHNTCCCDLFKIILYDTIS